MTAAHRAGERLEQRVRRAHRRADRADRRARAGRGDAPPDAAAGGGRPADVGVAHDFNNLLTVVLGNVDVLIHAAGQGRFDERAQQRLEHVRTAAQRGATLTAQLLAFSRRQRLKRRRWSTSTRRWRG
ncbi:histidine kinase dimerization/phospho-acceptor domain-containing protein [Sphingomonas sp. MMS24-JH45]